MKTWLLINAEAGSGAIQRLVLKSISMLPLDYEYEILMLEQIGSLDTFFMKIGEGRVFIVGGDGSLNAAVEVLARLNLPITLGIIPAGTVNDFATYLGVKNHPRAIQHYLMSQKTLRVDIAEVNSRVFINVAAVGYVADIGFSVSRNHKRIFGRMAYYIKGVIDAVMRIQELRTYDLEIDGQKLRIKALMIIVLNSGSLAGINHFNPYASLTDGLLELYIIKEVSPVRGLMVFLDILMGKHIKNPEIETYHFKKLSINADRYMCMDLDGERGCGLPVVIEVKAGAVELIVPDATKRI